MASRSTLTLAQLENLVAAVDSGSITTAAERLHTSQSNLSVSIANLERVLGAEMLVRHRSRGVVPTVVGRELAARARHILDAVRDLEDAARDDLQTLGGDLRVGCQLPLTPFYLPRLMSEVAERARGVTLTIREGDQDTLQRAVREGELDLALIYDQGVPEALRFHHFASVWPYVIVAAGSEFATRRRVSLAELSAHTMVTYDVVLTVGRSLDLFHDAGVPLPAEVRATSVESVRALVAAGAGFSILNQRWGTDVTADGSVVVELELADAVEPLRLGAVTRPNPPSRRVALALAVFQAHAQRRHPAGGNLGH